MYAEEKKEASVIIKEVIADLKPATIVNTVRDGEEALAYLQRKGKYKVARLPDVVLPDINMPKKKGYEVRERMKKELRIQSLPVIILTTSQSNEDVVHAYTNGACSFIHKSVDMD